MRMAFYVCKKILAYLRELVEVLRSGSEQDLVDTTTDRAIGIAKDKGDIHVSRVVEETVILSDKFKGKIFTQKFYPREEPDVVLAVGFRSHVVQLGME